MKVEEHERKKEMDDLYLPPRSRKTLQQINQSESDGNNTFFFIYLFVILNKNLSKKILLEKTTIFIESRTKNFFF